MDTAEGTTPTIEEAAALILQADAVYGRYSDGELAQLRDGLGPDERWRRDRIDAAIERRRLIAAAEAKHGYRAVRTAALEMQAGGRRVT